MIDFASKQEAFEFLMKLRDAGINAYIRRDHLHRAYVLCIR